MALQQPSTDLKQLLSQGLAFHNKGQLEQAKQIYEQILAKQHRNFDALHLLGILHAMKREFDQAIDLFTKAIKLNHTHSAAIFNRANAYYEFDQIDSALSDIRKVLLLDPKNANAYLVAANALKKNNQFSEALVYYDQAIALQPNFVQAYNNRGNTLHELKRYSEAVANYKKVIELDPNNIATYRNCGNTLLDASQLDEALNFFKKTLELNPEYQQIYGHYLHLKSRMCDWRHFTDELAHFKEEILNSKNVTTPFSILSLIDDPNLHQIAATIYTQAKYPENSTLGNLKKYPQQDKIRLGYFSADFNDHAVSCLMAELFELHDKNKFELIAFSLNPSDNSLMRHRVENAFDQFIDVHNEKDIVIAQRARDLKIDIAIDLGGHTKDNRMGIFSYRAAPIQLSYIGYLGTLGARYFDYLIADPIIIPKEYAQFYEEKIIYLPTYQVNDSKREMTQKTFSRTQLHLPEEGFVFCCFNNSYKIQPQTFGSWMRILKNVDQSVLFLYADNPWVEENLKNQAQTHGVSPQRLIFGERLQRDDYLARYKSCDLFLDTSPYNAGTTASDALWMGLPVLTCSGKSFPSRMAASLLHAIGLDALATQTPAAYEAKAIELAKNPAQLAAIKNKLVAHRLTMPLFDTLQFTRNLETAFSTIHDRHQADLAPTSIHIPSHQP